MPSVTHLRKPLRRAACGALLLAVLPSLLAGCSREEEKVEPEIRPVRALKVQRRDAGIPVSLTGRIAAEDEVSLAFRISGRMIKMDANVGDRLAPGQVIAQLDPVNEQNALAHRAGQSHRRAGATDTGAQSLRAPGHAAEAGLDHARQSRPGGAGAADRRVADRGRRGPAQDRAGHGRLHRTEGRCARRRDRDRPARRRGGAGRPDDRARRPQGRPRRRVRRAGATDPRGAERSGDHRDAERRSRRSRRRAACAKSRRRPIR